jgi:nicotinate phosphoribosyltransferase
MASSVLLTDLYQLTMAHAYFRQGMRDTAVFELFVRRLPKSRRFLLSAGLAQVVEYLETLRFSSDELRFLASTNAFPADFIEHLSGVRFTGSVHAMAEGTPFFAHEPILRVPAPILEAQLVESRIINLMHFQTMVASKAARCVLAARGKRLVDFGMRRAHGAEAALMASRAAYLAGFDATATVEAGRLFGIPLSGTMAHSYIEAHDSEEDALWNFLLSRPAGTTLLIDTYDTERAARRVAALAQRAHSVRGAGPVQAVRIDSGNLSEHAKVVRQILDSHGCKDVKIVLSGNLDEQRIEQLLADGTPVDSFGVGTSLDASTDAPTLDMVYKLQEYAGRARRKRSPGKETWPGRKQVFREQDASGALAADCVALNEESMTGAPLLTELMRNGRRTVELPTLAGIRDACRECLAQLPPSLRDLQEGESGYAVRISERVRDLAAVLDATER